MLSISYVYNALHNRGSTLPSKVAVVDIDGDNSTDYAMTENYSFCWMGSAENPTSSPPSISFTWNPIPVSYDNTKKATTIMVAADIGESLPACCSKLLRMSSLRLPLGVPPRLTQ